MVAKNFAHCARYPFGTPLLQFLDTRLGLARIQNFKPINIVRQSNTSGGGGRGGGGGSCTLAIGQIRAERGGYRPN